MWKQVSKLWNKYFMCFVATKQTRYLGMNLALSFVELFLIICIKFVADVLLCILISSNIFPSSDYIYLCYQRFISKALVRIPRNKSHVGTLFIDQIKNICWIKFVYWSNKKIFVGSNLAFLNFVALWLSQFGSVQFCDPDIHHPEIMQKLKNFLYGR